MNMTPGQKAKIVKAYRRKIGGQPFDFMHMDDKAAQEAIDLMDAALDDGKPVSDADIKRLAPIQYDGETFIT